MWLVLSSVSTSLNKTTHLLSQHLLFILSKYPDTLQLLQLVPTDFAPPYKWKEFQTPLHSRSWVNVWCDLLVVTYVFLCMFWVDVLRLDQDCYHQEERDTPWDVVCEVKKKSSNSFLCCCDSWIYCSTRDKCFFISPYQPMSVRVCLRSTCCPQIGQKLCNLIV